MSGRSCSVGIDTGFWFLVCFRVECVGVGKRVVLENGDVTKIGLCLRVSGGEV